jgi:hypothetical protein
MISILFAIAVTGLFVWLVNTYLPMDPKFKQLIQVVAIVLMIIFICNALGLTHFNLPN